LIFTYSPRKKRR